MKHVALVVFIFCIAFLLMISHAQQSVQAIKSGQAVHQNIQTAAHSYYMPAVKKQLIESIESEPNNSPDEANFIEIGTRLVGSHNDLDDFFTFEIRSPGEIAVELSPNSQAGGVQLHLYHETCCEEGRVGYRPGPPYHIEHSGEIGRYYILVYTESGHSSMLDYELKFLFTASPPYQVYEDFEDGMTMVWGDSDPVGITLEISGEHARYGTQSLKVVFVKSRPFDYILAQPNPALCDISQGSVFDLWVYGEVDILFKLGDWNRNEADVKKLRAVDPEGWSLLRYDYSHVADLVDLTCINSFFLFPAPGDDAASGTIYLDEIVIRAEAVLEDFERFRTMQWWSPSPEVFEYEEVDDIVCSGNRSLRVKYNKNNTYQFIGAEPPPIVNDFSVYDALEMWVYAPDEVVIFVKLEDYIEEDGAKHEVELGMRTVQPDQCTKLRFEFDQRVREGVDLSRIHNIFIFPDPIRLLASGTIYLDDISLKAR
jgi:hypothetical protein